MNVNGCICLSILLANCVLLTVAAVVQDEDGSYNQIMSPDEKQMRITYLERKLLEDIAREEEDLMQLEKQLGLTTQLLSAKKRQLEIKKRKPYQCLVNIVQCF